VTPLDRHFEGLRAVLRGESTSLYAGLVARQHAQPLESMFARLRTELGAPAFERLVTEFRRARPPRDPNPALWAREFAEFITQHNALSELQRERATYDALCIDTLVAADHPENAHALAVAAFRTDPRPAAAAARRAPSRGNQAIVLMFFRDRSGMVHTRPVDRAVAAAITFVRREAEIAHLRKAGVDERELATGMAWLREQGLVAAE
jgi:Putative DNA-binding domain